jgi:hypothetical protein
LRKSATKNGARVVRWNFRSADDVKEFWKKFQRVPARKHRTKRDEERYCLALYFLALATHSKLAYPLMIEEDTDPKFILRSKSEGLRNLDVVVATKMWVEHQVPQIDGRPDWFSFVRGAIESKIPTVRNTRRDLLIYEDQPLPFKEQQRAFRDFAKYVREIKTRHNWRGRASVILSLGLAIERPGGFTDLWFVNWSNPDATSDFGERVEFEGIKAVKTAIRKHLSEGRWICYSDSRGRLMRLMPDGTREEFPKEPADERPASM